MKKNLSILMVLVLILSSLTGCSVNSNAEKTTQATEAIQTTEKPDAVELEAGEIIQPNPTVIGDLKYLKSLDVKYAESFSVDYYEGGYELLTVIGTEKFLVVPENAEVPANLPEGMTVLKRPFVGVNVSTTPAMSLINAVQALDKITFTGTDADDWEISSIAQAMTDGKLTFVGKYNEPDYEKLMSSGCNLVIVSSMIESAPEVSAKYKELGIPMLIDRGSEETHPLGKVEWMKFYSALMGADMKLADALFEKQVAKVEQLSKVESTGKTVAIFYITSKGKLYVRNTTDYVTKMVEMAGGKYIMEGMENSDSNSTVMEMEAFYEKAKDADFIIYMYSNGGKPKNLAEMLEKNALIADFKAVKEGHVWATCPEFFQVTDSLGNMVGDINTMLTNTDTALTTLDYLFKLQ